ncbi:MAG: hypothetical protein K2W94_05100 [Alphaproteobacteria bacterium]|nr:hypothetical protein [Alphaproteobacteria bacterium]
MKSFQKTIFLTLLLTASQNLWAGDDNTSNPGGLSWFTTKVTNYRKHAAEINSIRGEAERLSGVELFKKHKDSKRPDIKVTTTLGEILTFHDDLSSLITRAESMGISISEDSFSKDVFEALQAHEKSLRKMIHLIWGPLMIDKDCAEDVNVFMKPESSPFLFQRKGFEVSSSRPSATYSFPYQNDSRVHVAQIREIVRILDIDLDATLYLPFDPKIGLRSAMARDYFSSKYPNGSVPESEKRQAAMSFYFCMLDILKAVNESDDSTESEGSRSPLSSTNTGFDLHTLKTARGQIKFKIFMGQDTARALDGGETRQLILKIVNRLQGDVEPTSLSGSSAPGAGTGKAGASSNRSEADDLASSGQDLFMHVNLLPIPYGSALKPTTTAGYRNNQAFLRAYWDRTEAILASAEGIVPASDAVSRIARLDNRVSQLFVRTLHAVHNYSKSHSGIKWSNLVTTMLGESHLIVSRKDEAAYVGDIRQLKSLFPTTSSASGAPVYLFNNETEMIMYALELLVKEFKEKSSS